LFQSLLQSLDVTTLRTTLPPLFVVGASVTKTGAGTAARPDSIALELALPTYHTCQPFWLGNARIIGYFLLRRCFVPIGVVASWTFVAGDASSLLI